MALDKTEYPPPTPIAYDSQEAFDALGPGYATTPSRTNPKESVYTKEDTDDILGLLGYIDESTQSLDLNTLDEASNDTSLFPPTRETPDEVIAGKVAVEEEVKAAADLKAKKDAREADEAKSNIVRLSRKPGTSGTLVGVFSPYPMATEQRHNPTTPPNHEGKDTMARMFIKTSTEYRDKKMERASSESDRSVFKTILGSNKASDGTGVGYMDFLLQSANHSFSEKVQVTETLEDNYVAYFFGKSAPTWTYQGTVLNTKQDNWAAQLRFIFNRLARGTMLARSGHILRLKYDNMIVTGAMTSLQWSLQAGQETYCPFSFSLLVKDVQRYGEVWGEATELPTLSAFHDSKLRANRVGAPVHGTKSMDLKSRSGVKASYYTNTYFTVKPGGDMQRLADRVALTHAEAKSARDSGKDVYKVWASTTDSSDTGTKKFMTKDEEALASAQRKRDNAARKDAAAKRVEAKRRETQFKKELQEAIDAENKTHRIYGINPSDLLGMPTMGGAQA